MLEKFTLDLSLNEDKLSISLFFKDKMIKDIEFLSLIITDDMVDYASVFNFDKYPTRDIADSNLYQNIKFLVWKEILKNKEHLKEERGTLKFKNREIA